MTRSHSTRYSAWVILLLTFLTGSFTDIYSQKAETPEEDINPKFPATSVYLLNNTGSFGLYDNGFRAAVKTENYNFFTAYGYRNYNGYRQHSLEYSHSLDIDLEAMPSGQSKISILGSYHTGQIRFPGSLTKSEFDQDPYQADVRSLNRDEKKIYTNGKLDIGYSAKFGKKLNKLIEINSFCKLESFEKATREYRIVNKYRVGIHARFADTAYCGMRKNVFSARGELYFQPERNEYYENFGGMKNDELDQLMIENSGNKEIFISDEFEILRNRLLVIIDVGYQNNKYQIGEQTLPSRSENKDYHAVIPKLSLHYLLSSRLTIYASYGLNFQTPEDNQLDSPYPAFLFNQDLAAQSSSDAELGMKAGFLSKDSSAFLNRIKVDAKVFHRTINNEIVSYEVFGDYFFRNAGITDRLGVSLKSEFTFLRDLTFSFTYDWSHYKYISYEAQALETDASGNIVAVNRDFAGKTEPGIPENRLLLALLYDHKLTKKIDIFVKVSYLEAGSVWADDANTGEIRSYDLFCSSLGLDLKLGHFDFEASAEVDNIFNRAYVENATINSADKRFYFAGAPRNSLATLNIGYVF